MTDITLAIPIYNVAPYVEAALRSALDQDFTAGSYEVLLVDDCGTDGSMAVVERVLANHPHADRVRILHHPQNLGLGQARNTAIEAAEGRYLFFLDSDDRLMPDCLSHLYALAEQHQADVTAGSTSERREDRTVEEPRYWLKDTVVRQPAAGVWMLVNGVEMNIEVWNKLLRTDFLRRHALRTEHRVMEDSVLDFRMRAYAQTIVTSSHITLCYTQRQDSILGALAGREVSDGIIAVYLDIVKCCQRAIREEFGQVMGIYDLYCQRMFYTYYSVRKCRLTAAQQAEIDRHTRQFMDFVPGLRRLDMGIARLSLLACRLRGYDWRTYEYVYDHRYKRRYYLMARILGAII